MEGRFAVTVACLRLASALLIGQPKGFSLVLSMSFPSPPLVADKRVEKPFFFLRTETPPQR